MQLALDEMGAALKAFSTTQYGPPAAALDQSALDTALASAVAATRRVQGKYTLIKDLWHQLAGALSTSPAKA
jgi:hypothetical protein